MITRYPIAERLDYYFLTVAGFAAWDETPDESALAQEILARLPSDQTFYHGGQGGLHEGEHLLPAQITGQDPRNHKDRFPTRAGFVYVSTDLNYAGAYLLTGKGMGRNSVYAVDPLGPLGVDVEHLRAARLALQDKALLRRHGRDGILDRVTAFTCPSAEMLSEVVSIDESTARAMHREATKEAMGARHG
jgi:hypothetical protein